MRHALAALLFAAPICALAAPAVAQSDPYGPFGPVGAVVAAPFNVAGAVISAPFGGGMTVASKTGAPTYSYSTMPQTPPCSRR
jgi:hypothetical protein